MTPNTFARRFIATAVLIDAAVILVLWAVH
jgi:hypothetical protein